MSYSTTTKASSSSITSAVENYFNAVSTTNGILDRDAYNWRFYCFKHGQAIVKQLKIRGYEIENKKILDIGCGWGGHAIAFTEAGAIVTAIDLNDHKFSMLNQFAKENKLSLITEIGDCQNLKYGDESFDLILGLELIEHIDSDKLFAQEIKRLLCKNGIAIISTPPRVKSIIMGEPHFGLKWLALLPFKIQEKVARKIFKKDYPFPITRQYTFSSSVSRPFIDLGLNAEVLISNGIQNRIPKFLHPLFRLVFWSQFYFKK